LRFITLALAAMSVAAFTPSSSLGQATRTPVQTSVKHFSSFAQSVQQSSSALSATTVEQTKLYDPKKKEIPKVLGGMKIGLRELVVITGASSGLGLATAKQFMKQSGKYFLVMACRDVEKGKQGRLQTFSFSLWVDIIYYNTRMHGECTEFSQFFLNIFYTRTVAKENGFPDNAYVVMKLELASLQSVRDFVANLKAFKSARPLNHLICNAAVYRPTDPKPAYTDDGFEMSMGVNHLGHFLLVNLLIDDMARAKNARCVIVGSITGNSNTVGGGLVYPLADLGDLKGFEKGTGFEMADGKPFFGAKAYKDSKVCNMMTVSELHRNYHEDTGITFSSMYPGCIADTPLFREKRTWFRKIFPLFMKYVTGGYVGEDEAGERLFQTVDDPRCAKSGVYWSWNGGAKTVGRWSEDGKPRGAGGSGGEIFENEYSDLVRNEQTARKMWDLSKKLVGLSDKEMYKNGALEKNDY